MNRQNWRLFYTVDTLLAAATAKADHHTQRLAWWESSKAEVIHKIKEEGLEIDESLAATLSNTYTRGASVNVRNDLLRDLQECVEKVREHSAKVADYSAWCKILKSQSSDAVFELHQDDWMFFFG
jgi:hypothetical protein